MAQVVVRLEGPVEAELPIPNDNTVRRLVASSTIASRRLGADAGKRSLGNATARVDARARSPLSLLTPVKRTAKDAPARPKQGARKVAEKASLIHANMYDALAQEGQLDIESSSTVPEAPAIAPVMPASVSVMTQAKKTKRVQSSHEHPDPLEFDKEFPALD